MEKAIPLPDAEAVATVETADPSDSGSEADSGSHNDDEEEEEKEQHSSDEEDVRAKVPRHRDDQEEEEEQLRQAVQDGPAVLEAALNGSNGDTPSSQRSGIGARGRGGIGSMARAAAAAVAPLAPSTSTTLAGQADTPGTSASGTPEPTAARERRSFLTGGGSRAGTPSGSGLGIGTGGSRKAPAAISKEEQKHFSKLATQGSFGFKLLEKMGWAAGSGLGAGGEGIVTPIESKLRPKAMGLAYEGFKERTKQSKEEERRRKGDDAAAAGDASDSDEDGGAPGRRKRKKGKGAAAGGADKSGEKAGPPAWKQPKARKPKVQHMTYEQIVAQQAGGAVGSSDYPAANGGIGVIYDLAGNELPTAALSGTAHVHDVPTSEMTRLPELRHNLAIIVDTTKGDLDNLAREGRNVADRRKWLSKEEDRIRAVVQSEEGSKSCAHHSSGGSLGWASADRPLLPCAEIARLETITAAAAEVQKLSTSSRYDERSVADQLQVFSGSFDNLLSTATGAEFEQYRLDEVVVGAIAPIMKAAWQEWGVLANPTAYLDDLRTWRKAYRLQKRELADGEDSLQFDLLGGAAGYGGAARSNNKPGAAQQRTMTAFETLLWTQWMPRVRSAVNNEWDPAFPAPVITLYSAWTTSGLLPRFLSDNILDQLVLPKLRKAIENWMPPRKGARKGKEHHHHHHQQPSLHHIVFPWLEHAGERMDEIMDEAKRRVRGWLKSWKPARDGVPQGLEAWREVVAKAEWDNLTLQHVVPQLSAYLRENFSVNPRQQDLTPLLLVLSCRPLLRSSILSQILEAEFFPKFLDALYTWLVSPSVNYEQVAEWYTWWRKEVFGESSFSSCGNLPGVERGFAKALDIMNQAMAMGEDAKYRLDKPDFSRAALVSSSSLSSTVPSASRESVRRADRDSSREAGKAGMKARQKEEEVTGGRDVTFRSVVEEMAAEANLIMLPTGRSHEVSGMPLFRVSRSIEGKSGVTVYLQGDVVYAQCGGGSSMSTEWKPISVQELIERALGGR